MGVSGQDSPQGIADAGCAGDAAAARPSLQVSPVVCLGGCEVDTDALGSGKRRSPEHAGKTWVLSQDSSQGIADAWCTGDAATPQHMLVRPAVILLAQIRSLVLCATTIAGRTACGGALTGRCYLSALLSMRRGPRARVSPTICNAHGSDPLPGCVCLSMQA